MILCFSSLKVMKYCRPRDTNHGVGFYTVHVGCSTSFKQCVNFVCQHNPLVRFRCLILFSTSSFIVSNHNKKRLCRSSYCYVIKFVVRLSSPRFYRNSYVVKMCRLNVLPQICQVTGKRCVFDDFVTTLNKP